MIADSNSSHVRGKHIPMHEVVGFPRQVDADKLLKKLSELNDVDKSDSKYSISNEQIAFFEEILKCPERIESNSSLFENLWEKCILPVITTWTKDTMFPVLDILRWYLGKKGNLKVNDKVAKDVINVILSPENGLFTSKTPEIALRLTLRILSNCFFHSSLHKVLLENRESVIGTLNNIVESSATIAEGKVLIRFSACSIQIKIIYTVGALI